MNTYKLTENQGGGFTVEISRDGGEISIRHFATEDAARRWIEEQGEDGDPKSMRHPDTQQGPTRRGGA